MHGGPSLLASAVNRPCELRMVNTKLTVVQLEAILTNICAEANNVKKLNISNNNLRAVDPDLLARAVNRLEEVEICSPDWDL